MKRQRRPAPRSGSAPRVPAAARVHQPSACAAPLLVGARPPGVDLGNTLDIAGIGTAAEPQRCGRNR
jgi:hypothetical protein